jgi:hypothetical protein
MFKQVDSLAEIPSPLIIEGDDATNVMDQLNLRTLCREQSACGLCPSCLKIKKGFHPDLIALKEYGIEEIREAIYKLHQRPFEAPYRVFALYDFAQANAAVQNALLKTLEEPSRFWKIWLGTSSRLTLLPTLRSRCLILKANNEAPIELEAEDLELFDFITNKNELELVGKMESTLKDRQKTRQIFIKLLTHASKRSYPGHWKFLAPAMEDSLSDLTRNLNPRIVWERIWTQSLLV